MVNPRSGRLVAGHFAGTRLRRSFDTVHRRAQDAARASARAAPEPPTWPISPATSTRSEGRRSAPMIRNIHGMILAMSDDGD